MPHVALENVRKAARVLLRPVERPVGALADPVGVGIGDEAALEERLDDVAQRVVDDPVAERGGGDQSPFGLVDVEGVVATGLVRFVRQLAA